MMPYCLPFLILFMKNKGFSLVELLLVLGVIAVILVGAFVVYPQVRDKHRATTEASNIITIQTSVRNIFASRFGNYAGLGNGRAGNDLGIANQARVFPASMNGGNYSKDVKILSAWGQPVTVWHRPAITTPFGSFPDKRTFGILYEKVPSSVCVHLAPALAGEGFLSLEIGKIEVGATKQVTDLITK